MLQEVQKVRQIENEPARRWFSDENMDVFVWNDDVGHIIQFQICSRKGAEENALTWNFEQGFSMHHVDDGENRSFRMKGTPILTERSHMDLQGLATEFEALADNMDHKTVQFILQQLAQ